MRQTTGDIRWAWLFVGVVVLGITGCTNSDPQRGDETHFGTCKTTSDCTGALRCVAGHCQSPGPDASSVGGNGGGGVPAAGGGPVSGGNPGAGGSMCDGACVSATEASAHGDTEASVVKDASDDAISDADAIATDVCSQPPDFRQCESTALFVHDPVAHACQNVGDFRCPNNDNGFYTLEECQARCPD